MRNFKIDFGKVMINNHRKALYLYTIKCFINVRDLFSICVYIMM